MIIRIVKLTSKNFSIGWLGDYQNANFLLQCHAGKTAGNNRKAIAGLNILGNKIQREVAKVICPVMHAFILPILIYSVPAL